MKRLIGAFAAFASAMALCFALTACGQNAEPNYDGNYIGTWKVVEMQTDSSDSMDKTLKRLDAVGKSVMLYLNEDKTAQFDMAGTDSMEGTWEALSESQCDIHFDGYAATTASIDEDGLLRFEESGREITCEKQQEG